MTHAHAFRVSVNPPSHLAELSGFARLRSLARPAAQGLLLAALLLFLAGTAQAAGSSMPSKGPLQSILEYIQRQVARIVAGIIIIATALTLPFRAIGLEELRGGMEVSGSARITCTLK